jgi:hypothetical protein
VGLGQQPAGLLRLRRRRAKEEPGVGDLKPGERALVVAVGEQRERAFGEGQCLVDVARGLGDQRGVPEHRTPGGGRAAALDRDEGLLSLDGRLGQVAAHVVATDKGRCQSGVLIRTGQPEVADLAQCRAREVDRVVVVAGLLVAADQVDGDGEVVVPPMPVAGRGGELLELGGSVAEPADCLQRLGPDPMGLRVQPR